MVTPFVVKEIHDANGRRQTILIIVIKTILFIEIHSNIQIQWLTMKKKWAKKKMQII
jgi:hypothetical protein